MLRKVGSGLIPPWLMWQWVGHPPIYLARGGGNRGWLATYLVGGSSIHLVVEGAEFRELITSFMACEVSGALYRPHTHEQNHRCQ